LSRVKREEVQEFMKNQLKKRYIQSSKSLQKSPLFFVPKKNAKKMMAWDY